MVKETQIVLDIVPNLPTKDLLQIQQIITDQLLQRTEKYDAPSQTKPNGSSAPVEAELSEIFGGTFTLEELQEIATEMKMIQQGNLPTLPLGARTSTELISEDREDRL
jgi:hypothetical protein